MPSYEYKCTNKECYNISVEMNIPISERDKVRKCPVCGKKSVRILSVPGLIII